MSGIRHLTSCAVAAGLTSAVGSVVGADYFLEDVAYLSLGRTETMDVYRPTAEWSRPTPAVIWIHGGSWVKGDKPMRASRTSARP